MCESSTYCIPCKLKQNSNKKSNFKKGLVICLFVWMDTFREEWVSKLLAFLAMLRTGCSLTSCVLTNWPNYSLDSKLLTFGDQKGTGSLTLTRPSELRYKISDIWISYLNFALPLRFWSLRNALRYISPPLREDLQNLD